MDPEESARLVADYKKGGNEAFQEGRMEEAIAMFSMGIELDEKNHILYSNRSGAYCKMGKFERALDDANEVIEINPDWAKGYSRKAAAFQGLERDAEALQLYTKSLRMDPNSQPVKVAVEALTIKIEKKKQELLDANQEDVKKAATLQQQGNNLKKDGKLQEAVAKYEEALTYQRDLEKKGTLYSNLAAVKLLLEDPKAALEDSDKAIELRPNWSRGYSRRGACLWALKDLRLARAAYTECMANCTGDEISTMEDVKNIILKLSDEIDFEQTQSENPNSPYTIAEGHKRLGNNALKQNNLSEAISEYTLGITADPTHYILFSNRSAAFASVGDFSSSLSDAQQCISLQPEFPKGHARKAHAIYSLAASSGDIKRLQGAIKSYLDAVELDPENEEYMNRVLEIEKKITNIKETKEAEEERAKNPLLDLVVVEPKKQQLVLVEEPEVLGDRKYDAGDYRGALGHYTTALKKEKIHKLILKRGICWSKLGRFPKALEDLNAAQEMLPNDLDTLWQKGNILIKAAGRKKETDPDISEKHFEDAVACFQIGANREELSGTILSERRFEEALRHSINEQAAFTLIKEDLVSVLRRKNAKGKKPRGKLDWKNMSEEEKKYRTEDMKRKRDDGMFNEYLSNQLKRGKGKEVGMAQQKRKNKKFHTEMSAKYTYTADGV